MLCIYKTDKTGKVVHTEDVVPGCWINLEAPTKEEIARVCKDTGIAPDFIQDALDREEKPRIDWEDSDQTKFVLIDVPIDDETNDDVSFDTLPLGMITVRDDIFITVSLQNTEVVNRFKSGYRRKFSTRLKSRFVLQIFYEAASSYLKCLKVLNKEKDTVEHELAKTYKNPELLALLNIQKSLVYFETSLKANESVMEKLLRGKTMTLYEDDEEALEDAIIENKQALERLGKHDGRIWFADIEQLVLDHALLDERDHFPSNSHGGSRILGDERGGTDARQSMGVLDRVLGQHRSKRHHQLADQQTQSVKPASLYCLMCRSPVSALRDK